WIFTSPRSMRRTGFEKRNASIATPWPGPIAGGFTPGLRTLLKERAECRWVRRCWMAGCMDCCCLTRSRGTPNDRNGLMVAKSAHCARLLANDSDVRDSDRRRKRRQRQSETCPSAIGDMPFRRGEQNRADQITPSNFVVLPVAAVSARQV